MSNWREIRISELSTIDIGGTPSRAIPAFWAEKPSGHPWISIADLKGKYVFQTKEHITAFGVRSSNVKLIPEHTTVMSFKLTVGRTAITGREMFCNEAIAIFQPKDDRLNGKWLYHALPRAATSVVTDTAVKGATLNKAKMAEMTLNLPPPGEQSKIAQVLDTLDTAIHETEAIIAKLKAVKQGLLHDLLTRGIDANGALRPPQAEAPHLYKDSPLGWIPEEWEVDPIIKLTIDSVIGPFGSDLVAADYRDSGVPVIFVRDIKPDCLVWKSNVYVGARKAQALAAHEVIAGDVVATKMGFPPCIAAVYPPSMANGIVTADIVRLRPDGNRIHSNWMSTFINAPVVAKQVEQITAGVTRPKVTLRDVRNLLIAVPSMNEQQRVLDRVVAMDLRIQLEITGFEKLAAKKSGLMDDLLTGRVRVTPLLEGVTP